MIPIQWRNDDIQKDTDLKRFKEIHTLFNTYGVQHTIAIIAKDFELNKPLVKYIKSQKNISVQLHCWEHYDLTTDRERFSIDLPLAIKKVVDIFGKRPTILFPPWNRTSVGINGIASFNGLKVSSHKISLTNYLNGITGEVINLH